MDDPAPQKQQNSIQLGRLVHDSVNNAHRELYALLDSLSEKQDAERKTMFLDYIHKTRHLFARLLVALRWTSEFHPTFSKLPLASECAFAQSTLFSQCADQLWATHKTLSTTAPMAKYAVESAVDILTTSEIFSLPKAIPASAGIIDSLGSDDNNDQELEASGDMDDDQDYNNMDLYDDCMNEHNHNQKTSKQKSMRNSSRTKDYVVSRLGATTRGVIRFCLTDFPDHQITVLQWRCGPRNVCVQLGIPGAWVVELSCDSLAVAKAYFRVHSITLQVGANIDSPGGVSVQRKVLSFAQEVVLRTLLDDRMRWTADDYVHSKNTPVVDEMARSKLMLHTLDAVLSREICAPLAMEFLKLQANTLTSTVWSGVLKHEISPLSSDPNMSQLVLHYWRNSRDAPQLRIYQHTKVEYSNQSQMFSSASSLYSSVFFCIEHIPQLPGILPDHCKLSRLDKINLEEILLATTRIRAHAKLELLKNMLLRHENLALEKQDLNIVSNPQLTSISLVVALKESYCGIEFRISQRTGALRARPFGSAAKTLQIEEKPQDASLWFGESHFPSSADEEAACTSMILELRKRVHHDSAARAVCTLDVGVIRTLPPGNASVAALSNPKPVSQLVAPFAVLERKGPRRFLTLSRDDSAAEDAPKRKKPRITFATTGDGLVFIQESLGPIKGNRGHRYDGSASATAAWATAREAIERRLRRDSLLRAFSAASVASQLSSSTINQDDAELDIETTSHTLLKVKCDPLPVQKAELILRGSDTWQARFTLVPAIFDNKKSFLGHGDKRPFVSKWAYGVSCIGSYLCFTYPSANAASVRSFFRDLTRARTGAALARGVSSGTYYSVLLRSPIKLVLEVSPKPLNIKCNGPGPTPPKAPSARATVEYVYSEEKAGGFSVDFEPTNPTLTLLVPLIEEVLDASGGGIGDVLNGILERACPLASALDSAVRVKGGGKIRFVTALRARAVFPGLEQKASISTSEAQKGMARVAHALDIDTRVGNGLVMIIDIGKSSAAAQAQGYRDDNAGSNTDGSGQRQAPPRGDFMPIPKWDHIITTLEKGGFVKSQRYKSTVILRIDFLEKFLSTVVISARMDNRATTA